MKISNGHMVFDEWCHMTREWRRKPPLVGNDNNFLVSKNHLFPPIKNMHLTTDPIPYEYDTSLHHRHIEAMKTKWHNNKGLTRTNIQLPPR
jgi:hypothetical protein